MTQQRREASSRKQVTTAAIIGFSAVAMLGLSFAAVPFYRIFCSATGYGGTTQTARQAPTTRGVRRISVHFDANVAPGLNWRFTPETPEIMVASRRDQDDFLPCGKSVGPRDRGAGALQRPRPTRPAPGSTRFPASASANNRSSRMKKRNGRWCSFSIRSWIRTDHGRRRRHHAVLHFFRLAQGEIRRGGIFAPPRGKS